MPSTKIFTMTDFDFATLEHRLRELAFLNSGVRLALSDARSAEPTTIEMHYEGGLVAFVNYLDRTKTAPIEPPVLMSADHDGLTVQVAMQWTDSYPETVLCLTNNIPQRDRGPPRAGFRSTNPHQNKPS